MLCKIIFDITDYEIKDYGYSAKLLTINHWELKIWVKNHEDHKFLATTSNKINIGIYLDT